MKKIKVLFIHHSTGGLLIFFGQLRKLLKEKAPNIELWDHGYNLYSSKILSYLFGAIMFRTGLSDQNGKMTGRDFNINISNNSPKEYAEIFSRDKNDFTLKNILSFDVIIFKNCFPTSKIESDEKLIEYEKYYSQIMKSISNYNNKFIVFTPPPLRAEMTKPKWADNARNLSEFINQEAKKYKNITIFDFFDLLADKEGKNKNMLKREYCNNFVPIDSHPNISANREVGKVFVDFLKLNTTL
ncbi:hypothetical protein COZ39_03560 [Candidatus Roizmanbacteria bacterium CG_4_10_14_3_um_filter_33_21]|uniref:SGNH hydrolase-type esterase domain-containing protein n=3 Tax=Candidatus Roizmaniibacteriota TaxID=1752723 RepID=A0A2M8F1N7_9BACT|nr:MAG: hypothetical protein COW96_04180 [Candidatus Roizmanbacteria bacterium CG22_combo_CG10-13_8_21_14_all_33_16]PIX71750.1 MAG: hypothetical protein COZ39_03560 [Candidatus Roizmanbacteria bacterium CG_4_10_14_3_um_filter_33_21]PJC33187.1 MAG: hypothetical protein CO048_03595 [Candidatus Roizmanbacteria bacterium CG_4_9_14_0_2_um_filter_35_15]